MTAPKKKIKLYTLSTCSHCTRTKKFFNDAGIDVEFTDVDLLSGADREKIMDEVRKLNPDVSFPTICIGDKIVVGLPKNMDGTIGKQAEMILIGSGSSRKDSSPFLSYPNTKLISVERTPQYMGVPQSRDEYSLSIIGYLNILKVPLPRSVISTPNWPFEIEH
jgi:glutaredoxin-like protein NrdH